MKDYAQQWVGEADENVSFGERHQIKSGPAETSKLMESDSER